ncbi:hypothetical protein NHX12_017803 [Muraenolepis orangiensis]|uniref:Centromere protein M n=1 Tax=Muraenolepis orangiensis TaxID=630683 RepID=A0A9Q0IX09_9TELE|nr:hypothetical protein NHX12_017803 [Muraenolepis orangiensis]
MHDESRPTIDLVVFIINLMSEFSLRSAEASLKHLDQRYFLGKVCFMVTNVRARLTPLDRIVAVRQWANDLQCPLLYAEDKTIGGVGTAVDRLLVILKVSAGCVPMANSLSLANLTRYVVPEEALEWFCA